MSFGPPKLTLTSKPLTLTFEIPLGRTERFWSELRKGKIVTTRCKACGQVSFPPSPDCSNCLSARSEWIELSSDAEIETYTHIVIKPTSFSQHETYTVGIGRFREGVKVLSWLTGFKLDEIKVGMKARLVGKVSDDGTATYQFIPM